MLYIQNMQVRPWHDLWAIACTRAITHTNKEKEGLGTRKKTCPKVKSAWADFVNAKF